MINPWIRFSDDTEAEEVEAAICIAKSYPRMKTVRWAHIQVCDDGWFAIPSPGDEYKHLFGTGVVEEHSKEWFASREVRYA